MNDNSRILRTFLHNLVKLFVFFAHKEHVQASSVNPNRKKHPIQTSDPTAPLYPFTRSSLFPFSLPYPLALPMLILLLCSSCIIVLCCTMLLYYTYIIYIIYMLYYTLILILYIYTIFIYLYY